MKPSARKPLSSGGVVPGMYLFFKSWFAITEIVYFKLNILQHVVKMLDNAKSYGSYI